MSRDQIRPWAAVAILTAWFVAVLVSSMVGRGLAAAVGIVLTWLFLRNGETK